MTHAPKDVAIRRVLSAVLPDRGDWKAVDYWDEDLCAAGIIQAGGPSKGARLVYFASFGMPDGHYYAVVEEFLSEEPTDYRTIAEHESLPFDSLLALLAESLA